MASAPCIGVLISTSSLEKDFLCAQLDQVSVFSTCTVVAFGDHLYQGKLEDTSFFHEMATQYPSVTFVQYPVMTYISHNPLTRRPHAYWHNISRLAGMMHMSPQIDWVMFLDGDEVPEGERTRAWCQTLQLTDPLTIYKLANYWYFRDPSLQATTWEDSIVLAPRSLFADAHQTYRLLMQDDERDALTYLFPTKRNVLPSDGKPLLHHFSWVRSKERLIDKVRNWAHASDKDWVQLIEDAWDAPFSGTDFVHGYRYVEVPNMFSISIS
jgi:hypothetical protein